jgi:hypothetical protein
MLNKHRGRYRRYAFRKAYTTTARLFACCCRGQIYTSNRDRQKSNCNRNKCSQEKEKEMSDNFEARMMNDKPEEREGHCLSSWSVNAEPVAIILDRPRADIAPSTSGGIQVPTNTLDQLRPSVEPEGMPRVYERGMKCENVFYRSDVLGPWPVDQEN